MRMNARTDECLRLIEQPKHVRVAETASEEQDRPVPEYLSERSPEMVLVVKDPPVLLVADDQLRIRHLVVEQARVLSPQIAVQRPHDVVGGLGQSREDAPAITLRPRSCTRGGGEGVASGDRPRSTARESRRR